MKKNLLTVALLALSISVVSQNVICHVNPDAVFFVGQNALVYNGGGVETKGTGIYDIQGNVMVVGTAADGFRTLNAAGTGNKTDGGNVILRLNNPGNYASTTNPSTYGQLFISGLNQNSITAIVDKEYRTRSHGTYQQIALPFSNKLISSLSGSASAIGTLGKTFTNVRYSKNEVLVWNNATAVSDNLNISSTTPKSTTYYMFGSAGLDTGNPPAAMPANAPVAAGTVYTLKGVPFANGVTEKLINAANGVNFGPNGTATNSYNERYNSYLQDDWDYATNPSNPWSLPTFGRNIYQFGNPYLTNLDLSFIGIPNDGTVTDNNSIPSVQGIRYDPGTVVSNSAGTYSTNAKFVNFTSVFPVPVGDVGLIIKPMQTFVIKLRNNDAEVGANKTLSFDNLRRFKNTPRGSSTDYAVTAARFAKENNGTVKQLGIIGLDENGDEIARAYYAVYPTAVTGHTTAPTVQSTLGNLNILGTFEEDVNGGYDQNYKNSYWLYINEANETDFFGKAVPLALYNESIKSLKFELRENTDLLEDGVHNMSTGIGFYYKSPNGPIAEIAQNQVIPVSGDEYSLYYGKAPVVLGTDGATKPSRTMVFYNGAIDNFVVRFDPHWKKAEVNVYDMSGKIVLSQKEVLADKDFVLPLAKMNNAYIVTAVSENGEKISSKIIR